jgi:hypothetical protein
VFPKANSQTASILLKDLKWVLYIQQMSQVERPILAIDHTAWLRTHARTLKERTYEHQPTALPHGIPIGIGRLI